MHLPSPIDLGGGFNSPNLTLTLTLLCSSVSFGSYPQKTEVSQQVELGLGVSSLCIFKVRGGTGVKLG